MIGRKTELNLHSAWLWTCDDCGRDNAEVIEDDDHFTCPDTVTCEQCWAEFDAVNSDENEDEE